MLLSQHCISIADSSDQCMLEDLPHTGPRNAGLRLIPAKRVPMQPVPVSKPAAEEEGTVRECPICLDEVCCRATCSHYCAQPINSKLANQFSMFLFPNTLHPGKLQHSACGGLQPSSVRHQWTLLGCSPA